MLGVRVVQVASCMHPVYEYTLEWLKLINPKFRTYPGWRVYFAGFLGMGMLPSDVFINHDYDGWLTRADLLDLPHC